MGVSDNMQSPKSTLISGSFSGLAFDQTNLDTKRASDVEKAHVTAAEALPLSISENALIMFWMLGIYRKITLIIFLMLNIEI